jgi:hypothetical protein
MARHRLIDQAHSRAASQEGVVVGELNITFAGVCTSIYNIVPGVPMRTVLPNALAVRFGAIKIPGADGHLHNVEYYLMPHLPMIRDRLRGGNHLPLTGYYLTVSNAKPQPFCRTPGGFSLGEFVKDVALDPDVVFEGNAAAYFDVFGGRVWTEGNKEENLITRVCIRTEGTPRISITPLPGTIMPLDAEPSIETDELYVTNLDFEAATEDAPFDFLLNYLVAKGGIPKVLSRRTPGLPPEPKRLTMIHLGERLKALGTLIETEGTVSGWRAAVKRGDEPGPLPKPASPGQDVGSFTGKLATMTIDPVPFNQSCSPGSLP